MVAEGAPLHHCRRRRRRAVRGHASRPSALQGLSDCLNQCQTFGLHLREHDRHCTRAGPSGVCRIAAAAATCWCK